MGNWAAIFRSGANSGVYPSPSRRSDCAIKKAALSCGLDYFYIDLQSVEDKQAFFKVMKNALDFPEYFGMNWDALNDCLTDLSWRMPVGYVIVLNNFDIFSHNNQNSADKALKIFNSSAMYWKQKGVPFYIIICGQSFIGG